MPVGMFWLQMMEIDSRANFGEGWRKFIRTI